MDDKVKNNDRNLVSAIQAGEETAFKTLFLKYYSGLCNFAYSYLGCPHKSEEAVQEVFANFWESIDQLDHSENIKAYLFTSVRNKALDKIKKEKTEKEYLSKFGLGKTEKVYQKEISNGHSNFVKKVQDAVDNLPKRARMIYRLSRKEGLTYKEIAQILDISVKTVESQMVRTLKKLRKRLKKFVATIVLATFMPI